MTQLKKARTKQKLKLREVAERTGLAIGSVQKMEKMGIQTKRTAQKYAAALGCDWKGLID